MKTLIKVSIKVHRIIGINSRMSIVNDPALKYDISSYSPIILWKLDYFIMLRLKFLVLCYIYGVSDTSLPKKCSFSFSFLRIWSHLLKKSLMQNFTLLLWFHLCLINWLSKLSFIIFRVYLRFGFEQAWHRL